MRRFLLLALVLVGTFLMPGAAWASVACNTTVPDGSGATWHPDSMGRVDVDVTTDDGTHPAVSSNDAYDVFGTLFVNNAAYDAGATQCTDTVSGSITSRRYPTVDLANLQVTRVLTFVPFGTAAGVVHTLVQTSIVQNTGTATVNATVAVGEDASDTVDDLGSDAATTVTASSDGNITVGAGDDWAVTADHASGNATDPSIYHGWGQAYPGQVRPSAVGLAATSGTGADNWRTRWTNVSVPAGATKTFTTVEGVFLPGDTTVATGAAGLTSAAPTLESQSTAFYFTSLTAAEIRASQNVAVPVPSVSSPAPDRAATGEPIALVASAGSTGIPACGAIVSRHLTFDGTEQSLTDSRGEVDNATPGTHTVVSSASDACGTGTATSTVTVADGLTTCARSTNAGFGLPLVDGTGAAYDPNQFGALSDGGNLARTVYDAWDGVDPLTVGTTSYGSGTAPPSCASSAGGRMITLPEQTMSGLQVSRSTWVPAGGPGARLAITLRNASAAAVTVPVMLGGQGSLGSDNDTRLVATGDGSTTPQPAARWMVSDDADGTGDPALAHVWDGAGGADAADAVTLFQPSDPSNKDYLTYTWKDVTVQPGESATYVVWEAQRFRLPRGAGEDDDAIAAARTIADLSGDALYGGLSAEQISAVRNWAHPAPTGTISGPTSGVAGAPQAFSIAGLSGGKDTTACGTGTVAWSVDGANAGTGATAALSFTAGTHTVQATITGPCGSAPLVRTATFAASAAPVTGGGGGSTPPPPATLALGAPKLTGSCLSASKHKGTFSLDIPATGTTTVTLKLALLPGKSSSCTTATSKTGVKLLKKKPGNPIVSKTATVTGGKAHFSIPLSLTSRGKPKATKKGKVTLPKGVYRVRLTAGTATATGLLVVH